MWSRSCVLFASAACDCDRGSARVLLPFCQDVGMTVGALAAFVFSEPTLPLSVFPILLNFLDRFSGTGPSPFY
jgi:hypothetical protein